MSWKRNTSYLSRLSPAPDNTLLFYSGCQIFLARHLGLKSGKGGEAPCLDSHGNDNQTVTLIVEGEVGAQIIHKEQIIRISPLVMKYLP